MLLCTKNKACKHNTIVQQRIDFGPNSSAQHQPNRLVEQTHQTLQFPKLKSHRRERGLAVEQLLLQLALALAQRLARELSIQQRSRQLSTFPVAQIVSAKNALRYVAPYLVFKSALLMLQLLAAREKN